MDLSKLDEYLVLGLTILGAISALSHGLQPLVKLTKTEKDDELLAKVNVVLSKLQSLLSSLAAPRSASAVVDQGSTSPKKS